MPIARRLKCVFALALPLLFDVAAPMTVTAATLPPPQPAAVASPAPEERDRLYPFYMPMERLRAPAVTLRIKCDASRSAGKEVYQGRSADSLYGRVEGGYEFIYDALDSAGKPCVYPFAPWMPQIVGSPDGTQYILRSSIPGRRVTFRTSDEWASVDLRLFSMGTARAHFEMRDVELDFPGAIQPMGALHLEVVDTTKPGLFTAVVRRSKIYGGKNALFVPGGQTMLYVEDSDIAGNVGTNFDQQHTTYINGTLVSHFRNTVFHGQRAYENLASGHQLKDKAYLRIYENVTVSNVPQHSTPSAMPLIDATAFGFTWADGLRLERVQPAQDPRDSLVDLRTDIRYGDAGNYPWSVVADPAWRMPADPLRALDKVYLSVFVNTSVQSHRKEPHVFALRRTGQTIGADGTHIDGEGSTASAQQRAVSLAFGTSGTFDTVYARSPDAGWTYADPELPENAHWVLDRDAFARHALSLIGR